MHCYAHKLNLVLLNTVEAIPKKNLYNFITVSLPRLHIFQKYQKECTSEHPFTLKALSDARWSSKHDSVKSVLHNYSALLKSLEEISESCEVKSDVRAAAKVISA